VPNLENVIKVLVERIPERVLSGSGMKNRNTYILADEY